MGTGFDWTHRHHDVASVVCARARVLHVDEHLDVGVHARRGEGGRGRRADPSDDVEGQTEDAEAERESHH